MKICVCVCMCVWCGGSDGDALYDASHDISCHLEINQPTLKLINLFYFPPSSIFFSHVLIFTVVVLFP